MRDAMEKMPNESPEISVFETELPKPKYNERGTRVEPSKPKRIERKLRSLEEYESSFEGAWRELPNNKNLYEKVLRALLIKYGSMLEGSYASIFADVENIFVACCQNLKKDSIEAIVRNFNKSLKSYFRDVRVEKINEEGKKKSQKELYEKIKELNDEQFTNLHNKAEIHLNGVISVVEFIESRKQLELEPDQERVFRFDNVLDAKHKIDLIECIYRRIDGKIVIDTINLVQVKSSRPGEREIEEIIKTIKEWSMGASLDITSFELKYKDGIPDSLALDTLLKNSDIAKSAIVSAYESPEEFYKFLFDLELGQLSEEHKIYTLLEYIKDLKNRIQDKKIAEDQGMNENDVEKTLEFMKRTEIKIKQTVSRSRTWGIPNVNVIVANRSEIVQEEKISVNSDKIK